MWHLIKSYIFLYIWIKFFIFLILFYVFFLFILISLHPNQPQALLLLSWVTHCSKVEYTQTYNEVTESLSLWPLWGHQSPCCPVSLYGSTVSWDEELGKSHDLWVFLQAWLLLTSAIVAAVNRLTLSTPLSGGKPCFILNWWFSQCINTLMINILYVEDSVVGDIYIYMNIWIPIQYYLTAWLNWFT